jgi:alpha-2-macroglobulin-like protein
MSRIWSSRHGTLATVWLIAVLIAGCNGESPPFSPTGSTDDDCVLGPDGDSCIEFDDCAPVPHQEACVQIDEARISVVIEGDRAVFGVPLPIALLPGTVEMRLRDISDAVLGSASAAFAPGAAQILTIEVPGIQDDAELASLARYVVDYKVACGAGWTEGSRSLFASAAKTQAILRGPDALIAGAENGMRLYVQDHETDTPLEGVPATFTLGWTDDAGPHSLVLFSGQTNAMGTIEAELNVPAGVSADATMTVVLDDHVGTQTISAPVTVTKTQNILLTTDKPLYQPGQTMHLRSLALRRPDLVPESDLDTVFEVVDSKGNKVFKEIVPNDAWGIASADFELASEVLLGTYTIRALVGDTTAEKSVTVDKYSLPKFGVAVSTDKAFYAPGDALTGTITSTYFFGMPVGGAQVEITAQKYDIGFTTFSITDGTTDADGNFAFEIALPDYFVGQPLDDGNAFVLLNVQITDTAGQTRVVETTRPVVLSAILPQVVPESGDVVPDVENTFFLLTTDPQGNPVPGTSEVVTGAETLSVATDETGIGTFATTPAAGSTLTIAVASEDALGNHGDRTFAFTPGAEGAYVMLRTDHSIYAVGDTVEVTILCPDYEDAAIAFQDRVYLDVIKDGRTAMMTDVPLDGGAGAYSFEIPPELTGGFELEAYYLTADGAIMRDRKLVYADPADALHIAVEADKDVYAPADEASLTLTVTDDLGAPVPSAIGMQIVDEAVYSLMEFRPGLEKVFYAIEDEIMTPKYEIHGYDSEDVFNGDSVGEVQRDAAARLLFAAAGGGSYGISQETYGPVSAAAQAKVQAQVEADIALIRARLDFMCAVHTIDSVEDARIYLESTRLCWVDPWNNVYVRQDGSGGYFTFESAGPDEEWSTGDDASASFSFYCSTGGSTDTDADMDADVDTDADTDADTDTATDSDSGGDADGDADGPAHVRKNFPETLYVNPALITDANGVAAVTVPLADSITTWRMSALASSSGGLLGSTSAGITVFQDFFVDIDFPAQLTQDDEIAVPIAVYNYLDAAQTVTVTAQTDDWFDLLEAPVKTLELAPGEVAGTSFLIHVNDVGRHTFTVFGAGGDVSDAVARSVEVVPNGKEMLDTVSGRLGGTIEHTATIPAEAIPGASKVMVKIYPGLMAQAVEGLDSLLAMPGGCFEQTSSSTYPNVLVLDYMISSDTITPEIELKARDYINQGYQRLLTFECDGGGFEWFGESPANNILTAYGLLEFYDMSRVHPVDPAVITRTQAWLAAQQQPDGSFEPTYGGIAEGAINAYEDDLARTTAYLTFALSETGYTGAAVEDGVTWLKGHYTEVTDSYGMAMFANAMVSHDAEDPVTGALLDALHAAAITEGDETHWVGEGESTTYGIGDVMDIEATALAAYAMLRAGRYAGDVAGAINYLIANKDSFGNWETTQATILTLRLLVASLSSSAAPGPATIRVFAHDTLFQTLEIDAATSDVLRLVDLGDVTAPGDNAIRIEIDGDGSYLYQIVTRYYVPWGGTGGEPSAGTLDIDVSYDQTFLAVDDIVTATVTVTNTVPDSMAKMVLIDLGIPPGFDLIADDLEAAVESGALQKVERTAQQIILYVEAISYGEPLVVTYQLRATYPLTASSGEAEVHPYYTPSDSSEDAPAEFTVVE